MIPGSLSANILQAGNGLLLDTMGRILSDFGCTVLKSADWTAAHSYLEDPVLDKHKSILHSKVQSEQSQQHLKAASGLILSEDMPNLNNLVAHLASEYPHLVILIAHRLIPSAAHHPSIKKVHDANVQSLSGALSEFGQTDNPRDNTPQYPSLMATLVAANAGAVLLLSSLYSRMEEPHPKKARIVQLSAVHSALYLLQFNMNSHLTGMIKASRGRNILDGAAPFYRIYRTRDAFITIGNIETKFYDEMLSAMKLPAEKDEYLRNNQLLEEEWPQMKAILQEQFLKRTTDEWISLFSQYDTCVSRVEQLPNPQLNDAWPKLSRHPIRPKL